MFNVEQNPELVATYAEDESSWRGSADGVIRTGDPAVIGEIMQAATASGTPVTFSARRTSLTGAAVPEGGWLVVLPEDSAPTLCHVDAERAEITAPARTLLSDMETAAERAGFFFPPDPTSRSTCSIGGAVACNASGARSYGHGPTGRWVRALEVVLPSGDALTLRRGAHPPRDGVFTIDLPGGPLTIPCPPPRKQGLKNALGYGVEADEPDVIDLFVGSEGTLGYISAVTIGLLPKQEIFAALVFWDDQAKALDFVAQLQTEPPAGLDPMSLEWFDAEALALAGARHPRLRVPKAAQAALFIEQRHPKKAADDVMMAWYEALIAAGAPDDEAALRVSSSKADLEEFRAFRHAVPESINALARQRGLRKLGTDLAYPAGWLHRMVAWYEAALADLPAAVGAEAAAAFEAEWKRPLPQTLDVATFGHVGDNHLHVNLLPNDPAEMAAGKLLYDALARHCAANGGALSGEHGIGKSKRALLAETTDAETLAAMRAVKAAFDPAWVLGRGNVLLPD